jgi:hypothetical protein
MVVDRQAIPVASYCRDAGHDMTCAYRSPSDIVRASAINNRPTFIRTDPATSDHAACLNISVPLMPFGRHWGSVLVRFPATA